MFEAFIYMLVGMYRGKTLKFQGFEDFKSTIKHNTKHTIL